MANGKSKKKVIIFSSIGVVLIVLAALVIMGSKKEPVITVNVEKAQRRTVTQTVTATGKIQPEVQVIITPEVSGEITSLPVKEGTRVKKGDLLLKIKPDIYLAQRDRAAAELTSSKASAQRSASEFKRANELEAKGLISKSELEQSSTSYEVTKAQYDQADAALKQAEENLRKTTIYAPMDGTISELKVEAGERVLGTSQFQGTTVMTVADLSRMEARVDVGENDVVLISLGDTTRIDVDAFPDKKLIGVVYQIGNSAKSKGLGTQEEVTNFQVRIRILDKDVVLRPGMSMTSTIETETKKNVMTVPIQSVTTRSPKKDMEKKESSESDEMAANDSRIKQKTEKVKEVVFVVDNSVAKTIEVKRGISDDSYTEITSGLDENKEVVSGSYKAINRELEDGSKVKIEAVKKKGETGDKKE
ncbi:MAG TPA: efflux RND transporter periplasmic adaptor subunit [Bacteroidota bacterium]|jgi:HlyD family secretion protein|nr:efflux RND transporter periplasmic adaptor subunit [Bacteroidota bacterium]